MAHSLESEESEEAGSGARKEERKTPREGRPSTLNLPQQVSASPAAFLNSANRPGAGRVEAEAAERREEEGQADKKAVAAGRARQVSSTRRTAAGQSVTRSSTSPTLAKITGQLKCISSTILSSLPGPIPLMHIFRRIARFTHVFAQATETEE